MSTKCKKAVPTYVPEVFVNMMRPQRRSCQAFLVIAGSGILLITWHLLSADEYGNDIHFNVRSEGCSNNRTTPLKSLDSIFCLGTRNIFLLETSTSKSLSVRQACAVESAARHNPTYEVKVLMTSRSSLDLENPLMRLLVNISTVKIIMVDPETLVDGTPLSGWYKSKKLDGAQYKVYHQSDALRLFLLWRYGGIYLDMDVVVLRSMERLRNVTISDNGENAGNSVLVFDKNHELIRRCIVEFSESYNSKGFAENGPILLNRKLKDYCGVGDIFQASAAKCNVQVLPQDAVYPVHWNDWEDYFKPSNVTSVSEHFNTSYAIHLWNKLSKDRKLKFGSHSLYESAMRENCPKVHGYTRTIEYF